MSLSNGKKVRDERVTCAQCGQSLFDVHVVNRPVPAPPLPPTANEEKLAQLKKQLARQAAKLRLAKAKVKMADVAVRQEKAEQELNAASLAASHLGLKEADDLPPAVPTDNGQSPKLPW